jgi:hypothetical protein
MKKRMLKGVVKQTRREKGRMTVVNDGDEEEESEYRRRQDHGT